MPEMDTNDDAVQRFVSDIERHLSSLVVLTVAHLDHTPENCDDANLRAMCQGCHLRYDHHHHMLTAFRTRHSRKAVRDLFEESK